MSVCPIRNPVHLLRYAGKEPQTIERNNLMNVSKLLIKELIDSSLAHGRMLDDDYIPLQQFFVVLEHVMKHGLKAKKGMLTRIKEFWSVLECVEKIAPEAAEITASVRDMPNIKSPLGRARAWLRLAMMQKTLADYFKIMIERREQFLADFYESGAFLLEEEGMVIAGLLVGLNVLDCNMCIKGEDLDQPMGVIDFSLFMKDTAFSPSNEDAENEDENSKMATILDQKNYLEELNRHLNATVTNLQQKVDQLQASTGHMKEDLAIGNNSVLSLQQENLLLRSQRDVATNELQLKMKAAEQDISAEREVYQTSRAGLDTMYTDMKKQLEDETRLRLDVEKELELQIGMKAEMEVAMRLLERDTHEKQDTIVGLRAQIEEIKAINLDMYNKLQACDGSVKHKTEMVSRLEEKTNQLVNALKEMEKRLKQSESDKLAAEETARKLGQIVADKDSKRAALETDLQIEREWRSTLQKTLEQEREKGAQLHMDLQQMVDIKREYADLDSRYQQLRVVCQDQDKALSELGSHLSESKLKMEDLREAQQQTREFQWASDETVNHCKQCTKEFSISRRKHQCRASSCGLPCVGLTLTSRRGKKKEMVTMICSDKQKFTAAQ
ncbi:hypothetical protein ACOMHN_015826 [Nucella lapillus]